MLKWGSRNEDKGKHGRFNNLWKGPYKIDVYRGNNDFFVEDLSGAELPGGPVNGRMLKHCFPQG